MATLYQMILEEAEKGTVFVFIAGISCSGKTTMSKKIEKDFSSKYSVTTLSEEIYLKNLKNIPRIDSEYLREIPGAYYLKELKEDIMMLVKEGWTCIPDYDFEMHQRISKDSVVKLSRINVFEGLHMLKVAEDMDLPNSILVFVGTDPKSCMIRKIKTTLKGRHIKSKERQTSQEEIKKLWYSTITSLNKEYIEPQISYADVVIKDNRTAFLKEDILPNLQ